MRVFKEPIFFGGFSNCHIDLPGVVENGLIFGRNDSERIKSQCQHIDHLLSLLHKRLDDALDDLSGLQQGATEAEESYNEAVDDILCALGKIKDASVVHGMKDDTDCGSVKEEVRILPSGLENCNGIK